MKVYLYKGKKYFSEQEVRNAIMKQDRKIFGKAPSENEVEFWAKHDVTIAEEQENIESAKARKFFTIKQRFLNWRQNKATLNSSLGFKADSNERANTDISGLLVAYEDSRDEMITFRDADNVFRSLTFDQLKTLQKEIIQNGNHAYEQKWTMDAQVESAKTIEELDAIEVNFVGKSFVKE